MNPAPPAKPPLVKPLPPAARPPTPAVARVTKTFSVTSSSNVGNGLKIMLYGPSGIGKTSLGVLAPNPIFVGLDNGVRLLEGVKVISGIETFDDLRQAINQPGLFPAGSSLVLDSITEAEKLAEAYVFANYTSKDGPIKSLEDYGWGKGYRFLTETMRLLLADCEQLIRRGVNVIFLAQLGQATLANLEGADYLQDGPRLFLDKKGAGVRADICEWCDLIFRVGFQAPTVDKGGNVKATKGKAKGTMDRVIFTTPELWFVAKTREIKGRQLPALMPFANHQDDSIWQAVFNGVEFQ